LVLLSQSPDGERRNKQSSQNVKLYIPIRVQLERVKEYVRYR